MSADYNHIFNQHWTIYQKILQHDYMGHQAVFGLLEGSLVTHFTHQPLDLLDIGCGDAQTLAAFLQTSSLQSYTGIDLSKEALALVPKNVGSLNCAVTLMNDDFVAAIEQLTLEQAGQFDVIFSGFALHHVQDEMKASLFAKIKHLLKPHGRFYLIDVYQQEGESRAAYLDRYLAPTFTHWHALDEHEIELLNTHVRSSDYPSTRTKLESMASDAGFTDCECLLADPSYSNILLSMGTC
ncbi:MAG: class I SAM-dependent methyltransferase [Glaciecola sp.]